MFKRKEKPLTRADVRKLIDERIERALEMLAQERRPAIGFRYEPACDCDDCMPEEF